MGCRDCPGLCGPSFREGGWGLILERTVWAQTIVVCLPACEFLPHIVELEEHFPFTPSLAICVGYHSTSNNDVCAEHVLPNFGEGLQVLE